MTDSSPDTSLCALDVNGFLDKLACEEPAPGGGSAAALAGALAGALVSMVARLTVGRERYADHEGEMVRARDRADALRRELVSLVDEDTDAYLAVMEAYGLPKGTDEERAARTAAIQGALRVAAEVPLETAAACAELLELASEVALRGNRNAGSDAVVAALLAQAGLQGAALNVRINLRSTRDEAFRRAAETCLTQLSATGEAALARALAAANPGG